MKKNNSKLIKNKNANEHIVVHQYPSMIEWTANFLDVLSENYMTIWIAGLVLATGYVISFPVLGEDFDIWFHLAYGKHFVTNKTILIDHYQFSWSPTDIGHWIYCTWIGSSILYIIYQMAGIAGLYGLLWLILISVFVILLFFVKNNGHRFDIFCAFCMLLVLICLRLTQTYIKPQNFSTLFFCILVYAYFNFRHIKCSDSASYLIGLPILFIIWVNTHGEFFVGLAFISVAVAGEILELLFVKKTDRNKRQVFYFGICILFCYLATLVNPYGINYLLALLKEYTVKPDVDFSYNVSMVSMWQYVGIKSNMVNFQLVADSILIMGITYLALTLYIYKKSRYINVSLLVLNLFFFWVSMKASRATLFYPMLWFFTIYLLISQNDLKKLKLQSTRVCICLFFALSIFIIYVNFTAIPVLRWFGYKIDECVPSKESEFIMKSGLQGPIFNDYTIGGYMMWALYPKYKVWIDPRWAPYQKEVLPDWLSLGGSNLNEEYLDKFTKKYPFKMALIGMWRSDIIFWMLSSPEWRLAYFDKAAAVIVHKSLIPDIPPEILNTEVGTVRFLNLNNPTVLSNLFKFYLGIGIGYAIDIRNIYEKNVHDWYQGKQGELMQMDAAINVKNQELRQKSILSHNINN